jgi:hypothetical protein
VIRGRSYGRRSPKPRGSRIRVYQIQEYDPIREEWRPYIFECARPERAQITLDWIARRNPQKQWRAQRVEIDWWRASSRVDVYCPECGVITGHHQIAGDPHEPVERPSSGLCRDRQPVPVGIRRYSTVLRAERSKSSSETANEGAEIPGPAAVDGLGPLRQRAPPLSPEGS